MKKLFALLAFAALVFPIAPAVWASPQDDDHGKHKGWYKHGDDDDDEGNRHDNGKHKGWYKHGRYPNVRQVIVVRGFDPRTRHVILYDQSNWVVAPDDAPRCRDWEWDRDRVYVYDDDRHPGWYLLFNARLGRYVHVEFFGM
jgi:hypothetical protein